MRLLDTDTITGTSTYFKKEDGKTLIKTTQDVDPILEYNRLKSEGLNKKEERWYVGTIPNVICMQWAKECGHKIYSKEWREYAFKQLNLPDYRKFNQNKIRLCTTK